MTATHPGMLMMLQPPVAIPPKPALGSKAARKAAHALSRKLLAAGGSTTLDGVPLPPPLLPHPAWPGAGGASALTPCTPRTASALAPPFLGPPDGLASGTALPPGSGFHHGHHHHLHHHYSGLTPHHLMAEFAAGGAEGALLFAGGVDATATVMLLPGVDGSSEYTTPDSIVRMLHSPPDLGELHGPVNTDGIVPTGEEIARWRGPALPSRVCCWVARDVVHADDSSALPRISHARRPVLQPAERRGAPRRL